jgi:hypothetical protein
MLKARLSAAEKVAEQLIPTEADIDNAIASLMALSTTLMTAHEEANLSRMVSRGAFESLGEAVALMFQVRGKLLETHNRLTETREQIGLRTVGFGAWQSCPKMAIDAPRDAELSSVTKIAA